jgi:hypothetical protein
MYFIDTEHKKNYESLLFCYPEYKRENIEYLPTIYLAAFPEIFKFIDLNEIDKDRSALNQLTDFDDDGNLIITEPGLTSGTKSLVKLGTSCFNGTNIDFALCVNRVTNQEWKEVFLQAIKIRMNML